MEENTKIWNKKMDELTVKDAVLVSAALPIITIAGLALTGIVVGTASNVVTKFRSRKTDLTVVSE